MNDRGGGQPGQDGDAVIATLRRRRLRVDLDGREMGVHLVAERGEIVALEARVDREFLSIREANDRALLLEQLGQAKRAHSDLERIYAVDPSDEDVAQRFASAGT